MSACLVFVFAALLEYAVVNVIARKQELKKLVRMNERVGSGFMLFSGFNSKSVFFLKHKQERKLRSYNQKMAANAYNSPTTEKVLVIGNRLANLNYKKEQDLFHQSHEALDTLLPQVTVGNHVSSHHPHSNSIKKTPHSANSLHVDSAVSISGASQQSTPPPLISSPTANPQAPPNPAPAAPPPPSAAPAGPPRDDAQMVDFASSFLFPISFIIFNIIYWMVYLNMQVESGN